LVVESVSEDSYSGGYEQQGARHATCAPMMNDQMPKRCSSDWRFGLGMRQIAGDTGGDDHVARVPAAPELRCPECAHLMPELGQEHPPTLAISWLSVTLSSRVSSWYQRWSGTAISGREPVKIKLTSVQVDDQEKALRFYTEVLGFVKKADFSQGPYRWLTVASPEDPNGTELQLALNNNPAAKVYQQALFQQHQPAAMFFTDDVQADYERMKARGAEFTMPPTDVTASRIAILNDTCGNLIQVTQLLRG
jgi:predicted enzyme related to lactoylglutathione lyase